MFKLFTLVYFVYACLYGLRMIFMFTQFTHYLRIIYAVYVDFIYAGLYGLRKIPAHFVLRSLRRFYASLRGMRKLKNIYAWVNLFTQFTH